MSTESCSICLEELKNNIYISPCNHRFHKKCIKNYIKYNTDHETPSLCPLCKADSLVENRIPSRCIRFIENFRVYIYCLFIQFFIFGFVLVYILYSNV